MTFARRLAIAAAGLLLVLAAVFRPVVNGTRTFRPGTVGTIDFEPFTGPAFVLDPMDPAWFTRPLAAIAYERINVQGWLTWNNGTGCGEPGIPTTLGAVTSPLRWWTRWGSLGARSWDAFYLFRLWLAGVLMAGCALALGLTIQAAIVAGVVYMLSGHLVLNVTLGMLDADVLLPGLAWATVEYVHGRGRGAWCGIVLSGAAILLVGNPQMALVAAFVVAVLGGNLRPEHRWPIVSGVLAAGVIAALIASPMLFTLLDLLPRAQQVHTGQGTSALPWRGAASVIAPWIYGKFGEPWLGLNPFEFLTYLGLGPILLAIVGLHPASRTASARWLFVIPVVLWGFAFGVPPFNLLARLPVLSLIWWGKYQAPVALAVALLAGFGSRRICSTGVRAFIPMLFVVGELWATAPVPGVAWTAFTSSPEWSPEITSLARIDRAPVRRTSRWFGLGRWPMPHPLATLGVLDASTYFGLYPRRSYWYMRALVTGPAHDANEAVFTGPVRPLPPRAGEALAALAVRWILAGPYPVSRPPTGTRPVKSNGTLKVYELLHTKSRARLVTRAIRVPDAKAALFETSADPAGDTAFVEGPTDWIGFHVTGTPAAAPITRDTGASIQISVPGQGPRLLLLADTYEPGWRADAGAIRLRVLPANCMFKIAAVPPDIHEVTFTYDPMPLKLGMLAAGLGLGLLGWVLLPAGAVPPRRRRAR